MYIEKVLYEIDEDYKLYCDTIDQIVEQLLTESKKDDWFDKMSPDEQEKYVKDHPDSEKAKQFKKKKSGVDTDADNDGIDDFEDDDTNPSDADGIDKDADNDGIPDKEDDETNPNDAGGIDKDADNDGVPDMDDDDMGNMEPGEVRSDEVTLPDTVADLKQHVQDVQNAVGADLETIATAFKQPSVYNTVKAIGGGISGSSRAIIGTLRTIGKSLKVGGSYIHDTQSFQNLKNGIIKVDEFMQKNPALSKLSAVAVSGLAIGQWLRMSFSGDIESDFDLTIIPQAFAGEAGFKDLIATPDGIKGMGLLSVGMATGGLPIWMGGTTGLALALTYSGLQSAGNTEKGKEIKDKMLKWAESMGQSIEKGAKTIDKKLGIDTDVDDDGVDDFEDDKIDEQKMFIENIVNMKDMKYKKESDLKPAKYKKVKIFKSGWDRIVLPTPPTPDSKEAKEQMMKTVSEVNNSTDQEKQEYIHTDKDASYYIKEYLDDHDLEYNEELIEFIENQCVPVVRHYKNMFNYPRPYQLAEKYKVELNRFKTGTASTPSYPSGHTVQPYVVANFYGKKYPAHKKNLRIMADKCAYGRVNAGLHYPMDYSAGIKLADSLNDYIDFDYELSEDAPVNATGVAVSTDTPLVRSRNTYKKRNKKEAEKLYTRILKRYDY